MSNYRLTRDCDIIMTLFQVIVCVAGEHCKAG